MQETPKVQGFGGCHDLSTVVSFHLLFFFGLTFHLLVDTNQKSCWRNPRNEIMKALIRTMVSVGVQMSLFGSNLCSQVTKVPSFLVRCFLLIPRVDIIECAARLRLCWREIRLITRRHPNLRKWIFILIFSSLQNSNIWSHRHPQKDRNDRGKGGIKGSKGIFYIWLYKCNTFQQDIS